MGRLLNESQRLKLYLLTCAERRLDQPVHSRSLIRLVTWHVLYSQGHTVSSCGQRRLIRLGRCAGWTEFPSGESVRRYVSSRCGSNMSCEKTSLGSQEHINQLKIALGYIHLYFYWVCPTFFRGDWSWNIFYDHSLPSADSRRAVVVSFCWKNLHNTG